MKFCQAVVGISSRSGLAFAILTVLFGGQWLIHPDRSKPTGSWLTWLRLLAPFGAIVFPVFALLFLWPYGIVPM